MTRKGIVMRHRHWKASVKKHPYCCYVYVAPLYPYFLKGGWNFCTHVGPMKMVFGMVCLQHASSATEALFVVSKMYHHEFLDLTSCFFFFCFFFSKFDFSNSWHLGDV